MFPNDDICNVDAARLAAQRLFRRYRGGDNKEQPSMGKIEVNKLMKATYEAINMPYNPDQEDVFSFISVFDKNKDGKIELKDIEEMAVKYLCGEEALDGLKRQEKVGQPEKEEKLEFKSQTLLKKEEINEKRQSREEQKYKKLTIEGPIQVSTSPEIKKVWSPMAGCKPNLPSSYSPQHRITSKESASTKTENGSIKTESSLKPGSSLDDLYNKGKVVFDKYKNHILGVTEQIAGKVVIETYDFFGKKNFKPTEGDVKIWMKLCDRNKDGVVDWQDYKYFIQRTYERNRVAA